MDKNIGSSEAAVPVKCSRLYITRKFQIPAKLSPNSTKFIEIGVTPMAQHQRLPQPDAPSTGCLFPNAFLSLEKKPLANNTRRGAPRPLPTPNGRVTDALPLNPLPLPRIKRIHRAIRNDSPPDPTEIARKRRRENPLLVSTH
jgi:hypothetical protein